VSLDEHGGVVDGTVGWEDGSDHFDLEDEGVALVKVTLFDGSNPDHQGPKKSARATGTKVMVKIDPTTDAIPEDGAYVVVAIPARRMMVPGGGVILKVVKRDPKWIPNRQPGEKLIYGPGNTLIRMRDDGSIFLFTRAGEPSDDEATEERRQTVFARLHPGGFEVDHPSIRVKMDGTGFHATHSSGASVDLGSIGGLPSPLDALSSYVALRADILRLEGAAIAAGPTAGVGDPAAKSTAVLAFFTALEVAVVEIGVALSAAGQPGAAAAIAGVTSALATAAAAVPSQSMTVT
jgi:hypothetical protein